MFECKISNEKISEGMNVVVKIVSIKDGIVTAELLEFENVPGMILSGELSKKRIKNIGQATKIGKIEVCQIIKIDGKDIDLSLKRVEDAEKKAVLDAFKKTKLAYSIVDKSSKKLNLSISEIYKTKCYENAKKYGNLYNYFAHLKEMKISECDEIEKAFLETIEQRYKATKYKIRADLDLTCSYFDGVSHIKEALKAGAQIDPKLEIQLLNTPTFSVSITTSNKEEGFEVVKKALEAIQKKIEGIKGEFLVMVEPQIFGVKTKHNILNAEEIADEESSFDESD